MALHTTGKKTEKVDRGIRYSALSVPRLSPVGKYRRVTSSLFLAPNAGRNRVSCFPMEEITHSNKNENCASLILRWFL